MIYARLFEVTGSHRRTLPANFWTNPSYRHDMARITCYESSYNWHAIGPGYYGWYQMSKSLISSEGVTWTDYWGGSKRRPSGWYQTLAAERYVGGRYGNRAEAWHHERTYGWY